MESVREKNGGPSSNRPLGEPPGTENPKRTCGFEPHVKREEKESVTTNVGLAQEIKRAHSEFDTTEIVPHAKETARPSNRRRKIRVYIPSYR
jgi:hypothetical protein